MGIVHNIVTTNILDRESVEKFLVEQGASRTQNSEFTIYDSCGQLWIYFYKDYLEDAELFDPIGQKEGYDILTKILEGPPKSCLSVALNHGRNPMILCYKLAYEFVKIFGGVLHCESGNIYTKNNLENVINENGN